MSTFFLRFLFDRLTQYLGANTLSTGHEGQNQEARRVSTGDWRLPSLEGPQTSVILILTNKAQEWWGFCISNNLSWVLSQYYWPGVRQLYTIACCCVQQPTTSKWMIFFVYNEFLWMPASQWQNCQNGRDKRPHENLKPKLCVDAKVTRCRPLLTTQRLKSLLPESYRIVDRFPGSKEIKCKVWTRSYP